MRTALLLFPLAALAYFLWQARSSRLFLLGVPFLMFFRQSVFFDKVKLFWMPARFSTITLTMIWLVIVWLVCSDVLLPARSRSRERGGVLGPRPLPEELVLAGLACVVGVVTLATVVHTRDVTGTLDQAYGMGLMLLGYVLIRSIACRATRDELTRFIDAIVVVNTIAAALFVVHQGLHVRIYSASEYFQTVFQGQVITRTFSFMPPLLFLALAVSFSRRRWSVWTYLIIAVNLVAIWVSYTRTMLAMAAMAALITVVARFFMAGQGGLAVRRALTIAVVVGSLAVVVITVLPAETNYFVHRIQKALAGNTMTSAGSLDIRNQRLARAYELVARDDVVLGRGFLPASQDGLRQMMIEWGWDSAWISILNRLGMLGVVTFLALLAAYMARAVWLMRRSDPWSQDYGLLWFTFLAVTLLGSYIGAGFMDTTRYPMSLWSLAFLAAGALQSRVAAEHDAEPAAGTTGRHVTPLTQGGQPDA